MPISLFDARFYAANNPDLAAAGLVTEAQLLAHFQSSGLNEGRIFSPLVNLNFYRASNSDLSSFNNQQLFDHLQNYGVAEGRRFSPFVDLKFYQAANADLAGFNNEFLFNHLRTSGINEGRLFSQYFDINYYRTNNSDLVSAGLRGIQLLEHFQLYGIDEGRQFNFAFDVNYYRNFYSDLGAAGLNNRQLLEHFQFSGLTEGRISSPGFNVKVYLANNSDLKAAGFNKQQAYNHFVLNGQREGRSGSDYAGNSLSNARDITNGLLTNTLIDFVGDTDGNDYYKFNLLSASNLNINLNNLTANANLQVIRDVNNNGVVDAGEVISTSNNSGTTSEVINALNLAAGTYYLRVYPEQISANTNYELNVSLQIYNGSLGNTPNQQGWLTFGTIPSFLGTPATQTASNGVTNLVSTQASPGGWSNHNILTPTLVNSNFPTLDRTTGYTVRFDVKINSESHTGDDNGDGLDDRAGFSVIVLSSDRQGIELGFWTNEIWAQTTGSAPPPNGSLFTHSNAERAFRNTTVMTRYELSVLGNNYQLFANGSPILSGSLRDYSAFDHTTTTPIALPYDPYERSNFLFLGDNSSAAGANISLALVELGRAL
ncbi:MAG: pre-peptidase C-terminal domain-containing protein [Nostocaceae cyanobacterium]|nr:pre-peptidase C-terminal domain-containing protein [Nostocaceae cyanobacterium]